MAAILSHTSLNTTSRLPRLQGRKGAENKPPARRSGTAAMQALPGWQCGREVLCPRAAAPVAAAAPHKQHKHKRWQPRTRSLQPGSAQPSARQQSKAARQQSKQRAHRLPLTTTPSSSDCVASGRVSVTQNVVAPNTLSLMRLHTSGGGRGGAGSAAATCGQHRRRRVGRSRRRPARGGGTRACLPWGTYRSNAPCPHQAPAAPGQAVLPRLPSPACRPAASLERAAPSSTQQAAPRQQHPPEVLWVHSIRQLHHLPNDVLQLLPHRLLPSRVALALLLRQLLGLAAGGGWKWRRRQSAGGLEGWRARRGRTPAPAILHLVQQRH